MSLREIRRFERRAIELADRIGKKLSEGEGAASLLEDIQEQVGIVNALLHEIQSLADSPEGRLSTAALDRLKASFKTLVDRVDANVQTASQKGVRITPKGPPARPATT